MSENANGTAGPEVGEADEEKIILTDEDRVAMTAAVEEIVAEGLFLRESRRTLALAFDITYPEMDVDPEKWRLAKASTPDPLEAIGWVTGNSRSSVIAILMDTLTAVKPHQLPKRIKPPVQRYPILEKYVRYLEQQR